MDVEVPVRPEFRFLFLWVAIGAALELLLIPTDFRGSHSMFRGSGLFANPDFYYALISPIAIWWFICRLVPGMEKELRKMGLKGVRLMNFVFGFYLASALRGVLAAFFSIHFGVWSVNVR